MIARAQWQCCLLERSKNCLNPSDGLIKVFFAADLIALLLVLLIVISKVIVRGPNESVLDVVHFLQLFHHSWGL